jgi:hypothetical protein
MLNHVIKQILPLRGMSDEIQSEQFHSLLYPERDRSLIRDVAVDTDNDSFILRKHIRHYCQLNIQY